MNLEEAIKVIKDNANSANESLLEFTHERQTFNEKAFWNFYNAIRQVGFDFSNETELNRELTTNLIKSYEYFLLQVVYHFDKSDMYLMKGLPENCIEYCNRLRIAVDSYLMGIPITDEIEGCLNEALENKIIEK